MIHYDFNQPKILIFSRFFEKRIKKLEKEERIVVIEICAETHQVLIINNYMPTMMTGSEPQYREHLDKISSIIDKYDNTHSIIVTGDLNGS